MSLINESFKQFDKDAWTPVKAAEIFAAGWCNLDCDYCYIPKAPFLKEIHQNIIDRIKSGEMLNDLWELYGEDLEELGHWGTEPTLTVKYFKDFYYKAIEIFPKLNKIFLSSNFMTNPNSVIEFITEILPTTRSLIVQVQFSIDGPPWITDHNRCGGSTETMKKNVVKFIKAINESDTIHRVMTHVKPTFGPEQLKKMSEYKYVNGYYTFFDELFTQIKEANFNNKVSVQYACNPTMAVPAVYTKEDGEHYAKMLKWQRKCHDLKWKSIGAPDPAHFYRWRGNMIVSNDWYKKHHQFTCSAGGSCWAMGDKPKTVHSCHRTFYLDDERYMEGARSAVFDPVFKNALGNVKDIMADTGIIDFSDKYNLYKQMYVNRSDKDFTMLQTSIAIATCYELANAGLIKKKYMNPKNAYVLQMTALFTECPIDMRFIYGSYHIRDINFLKLWGNGALEEMIIHYIQPKKSDLKFEYN
jgi:hypothetical protein